MWQLHAMLAESREQDLRRRLRERALAGQVLGARRRSARQGWEGRPAQRPDERLVS